MWSTARLPTFVVALALLAACASPPGSAEVRALMQVPIAPASDVIFNAVVYANGSLVSAPETDAQWARLEQQARSLSQAGRQLRTIGPEDQMAKWLLESDALTAASEEAALAAERRSLEGILSAGGNIYAACTACHAVYIAQGAP